MGGTFNPPHLGHFVIAEQAAEQLDLCRVYFKKQLVKVSIGLCRGKKNYDKRDAMAKRDAKRNIDRAIKNYNRG